MHLMKTSTGREIRIKFTIIPLPSLVVATVPRPTRYQMTNVSTTEKIIKRVGPGLKQGRGAEIIIDQGVKIISQTIDRGTVTGRCPIGKDHKMTGCIKTVQHLNSQGKLMH